MNSKMNSNIVYVNNGNFQKEVIQSSQPVVVDFYADWCGPCRMISPIMEQIADDYEGRVKIAKLNVDENEATASQYRVMGIPTLVFFKDGKEVKRLVGVHPKPHITAVLNDLMQH